MGDVNETLEEVDGYIIELELRYDQLKEQVADALSANVVTMQWVLNTAVGELTEKINALEAMVMDLKDHIKELKRELVIYKAVFGNEVSVASLKLNVHVLKLKKFNWSMFVKNMDNFLWGMKEYFCPKGIINDGTKVYRCEARLTYHWDLGRSSRVNSRSDPRYPKSVKKMKQSQSVRL
ncbi:hypothetical protein PVK06_007598 [Gossypium arboreum]|uniref:Uncharacterized protein n=1 Tax=Gossypium arboreum TaxID=29729 RepID=A0ABR0QHS3_GOSAR|nr:hypothetical protein PVK06_007598 [Gossypium arboreum]